MAGRTIGYVSPQLVAMVKARDVTGIKKYVKDNADKQAGFSLFEGCCRQLVPELVRAVLEADPSLVNDRVAALLLNSSCYDALKVLQEFGWKNTLKFTTEYKEMLVEEGAYVDVDQSYELLWLSVN